MTDRYASLKQGLVGCWIPSVSGSGLLLPDLSGRGNNGVLTNMDASDWVSAQYGRALDFDGVNDYVTSAAYYDAGSLSFSFWAYFSGTPANYPMVLQWRRPSQANATQSMQVLFRPTGDVFGGITPDSASGNRISFAINNATTATTHPFFAMTANTWQHWAGTYDGLNLRLFNSGVLRMTVAGSFANTAGAWNVDIANNRASPSDGYFNGQLDDIRLYSRALSESEIKLLASKRGIGLEPRKPKITFTDLGVQKTYSVVRVKETDYATLRQGLVGAWCPSLPNGGSGNTLPDVSGYGNHGTLTNMSPDDWVSGQYGRALDFDGVDDVTRVALSAPAMPFTISAWILSRSDSANQFPIAFCRSASDEGQFSIRFAGNVAGDPITVRQEGDAGGTVGEATFTGYATNQWYHVTAIFRSNTYRQIYVNGVAGTENTTSVTTPSINRFAIGRFDRLNPAVPLNGNVDDVRVYSRELSEPEIKLLASRPGIGLRQESHRNTFYQFPSGSRRRRILTGMP